MSDYGYDDEPRRYRNVQTRPRGRDEPDYVREETYIERGKGPGPGPPGTRGSELVYRSRDESVEDIQRSFPPPGGRDRDYRRSSYKSERSEYGGEYARSRGGGRGHSEYDDDRYTAYTQTRAGGRSRRDRDDYSDYSDSPPQSTRSGRKDKDRRKSNGFLDSLGLGAIAGAISGKKKERSRSRSDERSVRTGRSRSRTASRRRGSDSRSRSGSRHGDDRRKTEKKWAQAAQAALIAGAVTAFQNRKEPGPWNGEKGKRVATAALGAGGIDGLLDRNPNEKTKRHLAEAVIGGLVANRLANGPRSRSRARQMDRDLDRSPDGRSRSRSRSVFDRFRGRSQSRPRSVYGDNDRNGGGGGGSGALKSLAAGGALAAAGTAIYDRMRSKSRRRRSRSRDSSADSYVPSRNRRRGKRRSPPSDMGSRSLGPRDRSRDLGSRDINDGNSYANGAGAAAGGAAAGAGAGALTRSGNRGGGGGSQGGSQRGGSQRGKKTSGENDSQHASESSSTTDMENKRKHMRGKELLTAGLATVATIHAVHSVYSSMQAHEKRHKMVAEGEITPQEARKKQTKAWVQDAAAVGIAALGIKGAFSEWKEMSEHRTEIHNLEKRKRERRKKLALAEKKRQEENQERFFRALEHNPQAAMMMPQMQEQMRASGIQAPIPQFNMPSPHPPDGGRYPAPDQSGNPYAGSRGGGGGGGGRDRN